MVGLEEIQIQFLLSSEFFLIAVLNLIKNE